MDSITLPLANSIPTVDEIISRMEMPPTPEGASVIRRAYDFANEVHVGQKRKSGEPYFLHPACVARHLAEIISDPATIAAGLLHDVVEDCGVSVEKLASMFPAPVPDLVDGVSKISSLNFSSDKEHQVGNLRKMILAMARDVRVLIVKLCDRIHNMQTLGYLAPARQRAIAQSTLDIYAPLANRIGMTRLRAMLEDLSMKYLYPTAYTRLKKKMAVRSNTDQLIIDSTRQILADALQEHQIPAEIQGRTKHLYSIYQKMRHGGLSFDEVHDILALRVITESVSECYEILGLVHSIWKPISGRFKDYIALPKENGYRSIHTSVIGIKGEVVEIQIRTHEMHQIAEEGIAAHWKYKERGGLVVDESFGGGKGQSEEKRSQWLRSLVDWLKDVRDPNEFMRELKRDVYEASVFCYTPKGDIIEMPRGSTALDIAFRVHTQLGNHCAGAKINNRMASIRTELQTGDIVEIITSKNSHPTNDWLQIAQTGRARNKIRHYLKESQRAEFLERGAKMLIEQAKTRFGHSTEESRVEEILKGGLKQFSVDSYEDLLVEVGCGTIKVGSLISRLEQVLSPTPQVIEPRRIPRAVRRARGNRDIVLVDGMSGTVTRMARCCAPLPGDPIVGFITQGRGISVHRADCASLASIQDRSGENGARLVNVEWGDASHSMKKAVVRIVCNDRKGLLSDVTGAMAALNINIVGAHTSSNLRENRAILKLIILIEDSEQLNAVIQRILTVPGVISASRMVQK
jgi:GTP pyrophosphokinase